MLSLDNDTLLLVFNNDTEKSQMKEFLQSNTAIFQKLHNFYFDTHYEKNAYLPVLEKNELQLGPVRENCVLGFEAHIVPMYLWNVAAWVCVKTQKDNPKRGFFFNGKKIKVVIENSYSQKKMCVDNQGRPKKVEKQFMHESFRSSLTYSEKHTAKILQIFDQLNIGWEQLYLAQNLPPQTSSKPTSTIQKYKI